MKESTKDELAGKAHEVKGAVKERAGRITNDLKLEAEGNDEKLTGKIQKKIGPSREGFRNLTIEPVRKLCFYLSYC